MSGETPQEVNERLWDGLVAINARSAYYDVTGFRSGKSTLRSIEREALGNVRGKHLLHLQCHFGLDTLSWARLGAKVTGVDISGKAIELARSLACEQGIEATFVQAAVDDLPDVLDGTFDIVFTSYGVLCWLPDLKRWAEVIAHALEPGGTFFIADFHPFLTTFHSERGADRLEVASSYFPGDGPVRWDDLPSYADPSITVPGPSYEWTHTLGDVVSALVGVGLRVNRLEEHPVCTYAYFPFMEEGEDGWWRLKGQKGSIPLMFSLLATKD